MKRFLILLGMLLVISMPYAFSQQVPQDPNLRTGKLPNGQTYYIRHNELPKGRADFYLAQKVGSVQEEESQRGLAHFLEHMAFNGSKHFPGNSLITELEKKGIRFGSNINASTSYDETIYKLTNIPLQREGIIDTSLLVLHDWAGFLTLDDKDIDDERGVIREEWRLSAGGTLRVLQNDIFPVIYSGTPYANRIPIGSIDVVNNFKYQELRDYYKKWYRPDLQGIIVVGDIDVDKMEAKIRRLFADIPAAVNPAPRTYPNMPERKHPLIVYGIDKEITGTQIAAMWSREEFPVSMKSTMAIYKLRQINQVISALVSSRFWEIRDRPNAPFSVASLSASSSMVSSLVPVWYATIGQREKKDILKAIAGVFTEIERVRRFGFTTQELEILKKNVYSQLEKAYKDKEHKANAEFISEYVKLFLTGEPAPGIEWEYANGKKIVAELSVDTINHYARKAMDCKNLVIYAMAQGTDNQLPAKAEVLKVLKTIAQSKLSPYVYKPVATVLLEKKPIAGKIVKTESKPYGYTQWTLSNGAKVWFKKTDYKEDKIMLSAYSPGGYSQASDQDLPSAKLAGMANWGGFGDFSMHELEKAVAGKDAGVSTSVDEFNESLMGGSSVKDRETLFQLTYLKMTMPPRKDQQYFDSWMKSSKEELKDRYAEPNFVFSDTVAAIMSNHHHRARSVALDSALILQVDYNKILRIYRERFADASDFTFFISGNVPADSIKPLVETYLGGLPSRNRPEQPKESGIYPPKGVVKKHFNQVMVTPKTSVYVAYTGEGIPLTMENHALMSYLGRILTINYNQRMREEAGGVYYISAGGAINKVPKEHFLFNIRFGTDPDPVKKAKLLKIMYAQIDQLMKQGPDQEDVDKAKGNMVKTISEWNQEQNAGYWNTLAMEHYLKGFNQDAGYEQFVFSVTPQMIKDFAKKVFTEGNVIEVIMDPKETATK